MSIVTALTASTGLSFFGKKCANMSVFYTKTVKICWRLGALPPDPRFWLPIAEILGDPLLAPSVRKSWLRHCPV